MRHLRKLDLGWCACIIDEDLAVLQGHGALTQLVLSGTQVRCQLKQTWQPLLAESYGSSSLPAVIVFAMHVKRSARLRPCAPHTLELPYKWTQLVGRTGQPVQVAAAGLQHLVGMKQLASLGLDCCQQLDDAALAVLATCSSLQVLSLERCKGKGLTSTGTPCSALHLAHHGQCQCVNSQQQAGL